MKAKDLTGQRFGRWLVLGRAGSDATKQAVWRCKCNCGATRLVRAYPLRSGRSQSCGCQSEKLSRERGVWSRKLGAIANLRAAGKTYNEIAAQLSYPGTGYALGRLVWKLKSDRQRKAASSRAAIRNARHAAKVLEVQSETRLGASASEIAKSQALNERVVVRMRKEEAQLELSEADFKAIRTLRFDYEFGWSKIHRLMPGLAFPSPRHLEAAWNRTADVLGGVLD